MTNFINSDLVLQGLIRQFVELGEGLEDERAQALVSTSHKDWLQEKQIILPKPVR